MFDLTIHPGPLEETVARCRQRGIFIPTFAQMRNPDLVPESVRQELTGIGLWDVHPRNLFRITWKNEPKASGGLYGGVNHMVFPSELTGVACKIVALVGKWFPTGAHKVGASYGCLAPRLVTGQFNPASQKAVWPSTGNYCRGGAYVSKLLGCPSVAILPEEMSRERFEWLATIADEVIATPGCESNVKEIFDKCWELRKTRHDVVIFNQFDEMGNRLWHYVVTGPAMDEVLGKVGGRLAGVVLSSGSGGTLGSGEYLKSRYPTIKIAAAEALQCPTLLRNGFGGHRIEGIGDKHVPWIHNVKNTDMVVAADDEHVIRFLRLFNEPLGQECLVGEGVPRDFVEGLHLLGISGIGNLACAIKFAKYYELTEKDVVFTMLTDSMELYGSRVRELREERGEYTTLQAARDFERLMALNTEDLLELTYTERKRVHNLKYYTWIEQQARELAELNAQWYDCDAFWGGNESAAARVDELVAEFNDRVGVGK
ncbi:MAG: pyridoxal-phosphate dependent enzyme [Acidobacteria bacterium]|nr:pyridoxal-phosphate dependent enzyme [Acidobacteriota bacterium]